MKRVDELRKKLDELINEFSDLSYDDIADELNFYASVCKSNRT